MSRSEPEPIPVDFSEEECQAEDVTAAKREMRGGCADAVCGLSEAQLVQRSEQICDAVAKLGEFTAARTIAMYCALTDEVDVTPLMQSAIESGRDVVLPVTDVEGHSIRFVSVEDPRCDLTEGALGILEPRHGMPMNDVSHIQLILVPGRAFDAQGGRLGRGGGYYDGMLSRVKPRAMGGPVKLGVCFACQLVDRVPMEIKDVRMDGVITEVGVTWVTR